MPQREAEITLLKQHVWKLERVIRLANCSRFQTTACRDRPSIEMPKQHWCPLCQIIDELDERDRATISGDQNPVK